MITKLPYAKFLTFPEDSRQGYSIAHRYDVDGEEWVAIFQWLTQQRLIEDKELPATCFLDFYNLAAKDTEACLNFIAQHSITYVAKPRFDKSGAFYFPVGELRRYHQEYRYDFDWLENEEAFFQSHTKEIEETPSGSGYSPNTTFFRVNEYLSRCHATWNQARGEGDWKNFRCKDFIALCYLQLTLADKTQIRICPECNSKFVAKPKQGRPSVCCSDSCAEAWTKQEDRCRKQKKKRPYYEKLAGWVAEWLKTEDENKEYVHLGYDHKAREIDEYFGAFIRQKYDSEFSLKSHQVGVEFQYLNSYLLKYGFKCLRKWKRNQHSYTFKKL